MYVFSLAEPRCRSRRPCSPCAYPWQRLGSFLVMSTPVVAVCGWPRAQMERGCEEHHQQAPAFPRPCRSQLKATPAPGNSQPRDYLSSDASLDGNVEKCTFTLEKKITNQFHQAGSQHQQQHKNTLTSVAFGQSPQWLMVTYIHRLFLYQPTNTSARERDFLCIIKSHNTRMSWATAVSRGKAPRRPGLVRGCRHRNAGTRLCLDKTRGITTLKQSAAARG